MISAKTAHEEFFSLLGRCSEADKADMIAELARQILDRHPDADSVAIADRQGLIGYLTKASMPQATWDAAKEDPAFWADLQKRIDNHEPCLTKEEVRELFALMECEDEELSPQMDNKEGKGAA